MSPRILATLANETPPAVLSPPEQGLWWLKKGDLQCGSAWRRAHAICQEREGERSYDLVHALVHLIEGDTANAAYWYRRAGVPPGSPNAVEEWDRISALLSD